MVSSEPTRTLWMGDLEPYMDETFVLQAFDVMGEPALQVKLINNRHTGLPAGYCFIDFQDSEAALRAQLRLNGKIIPNSQPPHRFKLNANNVKDVPTKKEFSLFVGDLSDEVDDFILYRAFVKRYSSCQTAKVVLDSRGHTKGYGFVRFAEETDQQRALIEMQHTTGIGRKSIRVSLATPKRPNENSSRNCSRGSHGDQDLDLAYEQYCQAYYQQYYANYYANQQAQAQIQTAASYYTQEDENIAIEDPEIEIDIERSNLDYMAQSEEIFDVLEDSRWHPMDQWNSTVPTTAR